MLLQSHGLQQHKYTCQRKGALVHQKIYINEIFCVLPGMKFYSLFKALRNLTKGILKKTGTSILIKH